MKTSLSWRFVVIVAVIALAGLALKYYPLHAGIDLAGGTSLLYELDLSKIHSANPSEDNTALATRVMEVLKKRVDPNGVKNLIWRVVGGKRIQIQMPLADKATREARAEVGAAEKALRDSALNSVQIAHVMEVHGADRIKELDSFVPPSDPRNGLILKLAEANDVLVKATADEAASVKEYGLGKAPNWTDILKAKNEAKKQYDAAKAALDATNVDVNRLNSLMVNADDATNTKAKAELDAFPRDHPSQEPAIKRLITAHQNLIRLGGGGVEDPADLQHLLTAVGVLDFRITVIPTDITPEEHNAADQSLQHDGPRGSVSVGGLKARWFALDPKGKSNFDRSSFVLQEWAGQPYVLCYDDPSRALTHTGHNWTVTAGNPYNDPQSGQLLLPFHLDAIGANLMGDLTGGNLKRNMAILLDDKAMSAPTIQARITENGTISFGSDRPPQEVRKEADELRRIMDAGSLPAALQKDPISVVNISPDLGQDNITAGLHSGIYALIAVVSFMVLYYTITGLFADLALSVNLLLVLAAMAALGGTFTLPGIAGLVLTLGMAVDANVLINERIREELHKGASLWMAVKQGYDKVFWTIFDANTTTSLTSIVLIYVGSEEVKGFGVTLLIGLIVHMFTALFVTRTLMMGAIKVGIIRAIDDHSVTEYLREICTLTWLRNGHWPFMRVITVTNFDWIGKRHIFWAVSALVMIAGLTAFVVRGEDKYDIEFRGGTQVTFQLKPGANLSLEEVRKRISSLDTIPGLRDIDQARVYSLGKAEDHRFEMQTTIANVSGSKEDLKAKLLDALAAKFSDVLNVVPQVNAQDATPGPNAKVDPEAVDNLIDNKGIIRPITADTLDQVFQNTANKGIPNRDVTPEKGGVAILLNNIHVENTKSSITAKELENRISRVRQSQDPVIAKIPYRQSRVIPITVVDKDGKEVAAREDDDRPMVGAVIVSKDEAQPYDEGAERAWRDNVASTEWMIVNRALAAPSDQFEGVTSFDAVVAGQAKMAALIAIILSLALIVIYVWIRFGGIRYGLGAIFSLVHDAIVALAATVLATYIAGDPTHPHWLGSHLLITDFKINLTMIAAYLTVIGYSVNDTIVIFDRVRELRGKSQAPLTAKLINDAINQCFGRTIWTTFTVFIVVLIMYIWGGEGVRGFSYAMLIGVITGAYSTLAIASPMLLATGTKHEKPGAPKALQRRNPFMQTESTEKS